MFIVTRCTIACHHGKIDCKGCAFCTIGAEENKHFRDSKRALRDDPIADVAVSKRHQRLDQSRIIFTRTSFKRYFQALSCNIRPQHFTQSSRGFHVTSYQANFASHHTRDRHVGFLFTFEGIGKSNKMYHYLLFSSYRITKLQPSDKNINTYTLG